MVTIASHSSCDARHFQGTLGTKSQAKLKYFQYNYLGLTFELESRSFCLYLFALVFALVKILSEIDC